MLARLAVGCVCLCAVLALGGCGGRHSLAPVQERPGALDNARGEHVVRQGESLYLIAWRHGLDHGRFAEANRIPPPYRIVPGQRLLLREAPRRRLARAGRAPQAGTETRKPARPPVKAAEKIVTKSKPNVDSRLPSPAAEAGAPSADRQVSSASRPTPGGAGKAPKFQWPTRGKVSGKFGKGGGKGIDIRGDVGQVIQAAAAGEVVYVGDGLLGYGNLIIIKHEQNYLSAYAHNKTVVVKEGEAVSAGKKIASLGSSGTNEPKLHFELRRNGQPVDPELHLGR